MSDVWKKSVVPSRTPAIDGKLKLKTRELLNNRPRHLTLEMLAERAQVSPAWLIQFGIGTYGEPGVDRIERLYEALTGTELKV